MLDAISNYINRVTRGQKVCVAGAEAQWKKVSELRPGMRIAVAEGKEFGSGTPGLSSKNHQSLALEQNSGEFGDIEFEEIVSIKKVGREKVYDIEVEGTHNFVAGHLIDQHTGKALTAEGEKEYLELLAGLRRLLQLAEGNNSQGETNKKQSEGQLSDGDLLGEINLGNLHNFSTLLPSLNAKYKHIIEAATEYVKTQRSLAAKSEMNQPADKSESQEDNTRNWYDLSVKEGENIKEILSALETSVKFGGIIAHNTYISGNLGIGTTVPTAYLHLKAGTTTASTAPLKFTAGTNLTAAEAGAMEWDGTSLYITQTTGPARKTLAYTGSYLDGAGTAGKIPKWQDSDTLTDSVISETTGDISMTGDLTVAGGKVTGASSEYIQIGEVADQIKLYLSTGAYALLTTALFDLSGVVLPGDDIEDGTVDDTEIQSDSLDFDDFQDTLDLDANLTWNTGTYTINIDSGTLYLDTTQNRVGIGNTAPGAALEVTGQVKITGGTPGANKVLTSDAVGLATWETPGGVPSGLIAMFDSACPSGWTEVADFQNRFPRGHDADATYCETGGADSHRHAVAWRISSYHYFPTACRAGWNSCLWLGSNLLAQGPGAWSYYCEKTCDLVPSSCQSNVPAYREVVFCKKN